MTSFLQQIAPRAFAELPSFSGFSVSGADAGTFLHNQLTNEVNQLQWPKVQRTGYCTPKGRLLAVMLQWKDIGGTLHHVIPAALLESTTKRLKMFVLRSKAVFTAIDECPVVFGLWGAIQSDLPVGAAIATQEGYLLRAEDCPVLGPRAWLVVTRSQRDSVNGILQSLANSHAADENAWQFSEIQCGLPWVDETTKEAFVPQMINLELVDGVSFTKGCYPGQEIVARSQYLGKLKRRMYRADAVHKTIDPSVSVAAALIGQDIWSGADPSQPCGQVVNAAVSVDQDFERQTNVALLIECTQEAWAAADLHLQEINGSVLVAKALPYSFPAAA
jgi:tRNA-modifying protein YgfZ